VRFVRTRAGEAGQAVSWLLKMLLGVAVAAILLIDFGAVVINRVQAADLAGEAATQAGFVYANSGDLEAAEKEAVDYVRGSAEILDVVIGPERDAITVTLRKIAATKVFIHRWSVTKDLAEATASGTAPLRRPGGRF